MFKILALVCKHANYDWKQRLMGMSFILNDDGAGLKVKIVTTHRLGTIKVSQSVQYMLRHFTRQSDDLRIHPVDFECLYLSLTNEKPQRYSTNSVKQKKACNYLNHFGKLFFFFVFYFKWSIEVEIIDKDQITD